jgi:hypothetical protein
MARLKLIRCDVREDTFVNTFVFEFIDKLKGIRQPDDVQSIYHWLWGKQPEIASTAGQINKTLSLTGPFELKPDLPCLTVGSLKGLVVLAANPGWKPDGNPRENAYCKRSPEEYTELMVDFFRLHPTVTGRYSSWWSNAMKFVSLLPGKPANGRELKRDVRWEFVHRSGQLGGWDLFPWHSSKDAVTRQFASHPWLKMFFSETVKAVLRVNPTLLLVASSSGYELVRNDLLRELEWTDCILGSEIPIKSCYTKLASGTEVVAIKLQLFGNAFRDFKDEDLMKKVHELRSGWARSV